MDMRMKMNKKDKQSKSQWPIGGGAPHIPEQPYVPADPIAAIERFEEELRAEKRHDRNKPLKRFGLFCLGVLIAGLIFTGVSLTGPNTTTVDPAWVNQAMTEQVSAKLPVGYILMSADEHLESQDHTIVHQSNLDSAVIWVWDYAAEDGDYVEIMHNGTVIFEAFMIKHAPRAIEVPTVGELQIRGVRDGGGGITYAVAFELNGTTYFNSVSEGTVNTYTLIRQ